MLRNIPTMQQKIFPIGLGAMPLSIDNRPPHEDAIKIIHHFIEMGGNFIDTANIYGIDNEHIGENERLIASALKNIKNIQNVIISTKGGGTRPNNGWGLGAGHPKELRAACEESLKALGVSSINLYYLHGPDPNVSFEDSIGELLRLKQEGKIQHIGIANVNQEQITQAIKITEITAVQNRCNPFCKMDLESGLVNYCKENNIIYVAYCPLGGWNDHQVLNKATIYKKLAERYQVSPYAINLAWLLQKGNHIIPIPGIDRADQINNNFKAINLTLAPEDIAYLDSFPNKYISTAN